MPLTVPSGETRLLWFLFSFTKKEEVKFYIPKDTCIFKIISCLHSPSSESPKFPNSSVTSRLPSHHPQVFVSQFLPFQLGLQDPPPASDLL